MLLGPREGENSESVRWSSETKSADPARMTIATQPSKSVDRRSPRYWPSEITLVAKSWQGFFSESTYNLAGNSIRASNKMTLHSSGLFSVWTASGCIDNPHGCLLRLPCQTKKRSLSMRRFILLEALSIILRWPRISKAK